MTLPRYLGKAVRRSAFGWLNVRACCFYRAPHSMPVHYVRIGYGRTNLPDSLVTLDAFIEEELV
jgi:hypothetical protein